MKDGRFESAIESAEDRVNRAATRRPRRERGPYIEGGEEFVRRVFPWFLAVCVAVWIAGMLFIGVYTLAKAIEVLCLSFTLCFGVLGFPCALMMPRGAFSGWALALLALGLTCLLWLSSYVVGDFYIAQSIHNVLAALGVELSGAADEAVGFLGTFATILFAPIGVTSVVSAYMRRYTPDVLTTMSRHAERGVRGRSERFFDIPDVIDVERVVLDPPEVKGAVDVRTGLSISAYLFMLGLLVSSYLFLNPYFLNVMMPQTMLAVMLMLSMFTPALILPWQIFRTVGAKVESSAPRDYYLWIGARSRLFTTFAALGVFMMMFLISVYFGNDILSILETYAAFLVPLLVTSVMYGSLYANNFERADREAICERFSETRVGSRASRPGRHRRKTTLR